jgi:hypothetical protein
MINESRNFRRFGLRKRSSIVPDGLFGLYRMLDQSASPLKTKH